MKAMEHNNYHDPAWPIAAVLSITSTIIAWIGIKEAQMIVALIASMVAIASGILAGRYYWFATKKIKNENKNK